MGNFIRPSDLCWIAGIETLGNQLALDTQRTEKARMHDLNWSERKPGGNLCVFEGKIGWRARECDQNVRLFLI